MSKELYIATNNGDMGGGEMMLMALARQARSLGYAVTIVGPAQPAQLIEAAADEGFRRVALPATNRVQYMASLRAWHAKHKDKLLWCNGLVPATATGGRKNRIVHLHQLPAGLNAKLLPFARRKALTTLVPSRFVQEPVSGSEIFSNWVAGVQVDHPEVRKNTEPLRIGYLGRLTTSKGIVTLCQAFEQLQTGTRQYSLIIGGEPVFASEEDTAEVNRALENVSEHTERLGWTTPEELLSRVDMLVVPSIAVESFGLVVAEAMSARIPVIVSNAGALPEVLNQPERVFAAGNAQSLAERIASLGAQIDSHAEELQESISASFWRWQEYFSPEAARANVRAILERFL